MPVLLTSKIVNLVKTVSDHRERIVSAERIASNCQPRLWVLYPASLRNFSLRLAIIDFGI